jgi:CRP/FNR family cyclic AMP-dependent transcriptional regulator
MTEEPLRKFMKSYAPGETIFREGEEGEEMYIIQKGKVRVLKNFGGKPDVISVLEKGDFFGEMAIVNRIRRTATVAAVDSVEVLAFDREGLVNMITKNARIGLTIIDKLCRRLQNAHLKVQHLVKKDETGLIALHLRLLFQSLPGGGNSAPYQQTLDDVSLNLELPRETVAKVFDGLQADGIIGLSAAEIELKDRGKLVTLTE